MNVCVYVLFDGSIILCHHGAHTNSNADERKFILTTPTTLLSPSNSEMPFEPVLRPAMQRMLTEDFDPPLPCEFVEHNAGRLVVRAHDLIQWLNAQVRQDRRWSCRGGVEERTEETSPSLRYVANDRSNNKLITSFCIISTNTPILVLQKSLVARREAVRHLEAEKPGAARLQFPDFQGP